MFEINASREPSGEKLGDKQLPTRVSRLTIVSRSSVIVVSGPRGRIVRLDGGDADRLEAQQPGSAADAAERVAWHRSDCRGVAELDAPHLLLGSP